MDQRLGEPAGKEQRTRFLGRSWESLVDTHGQRLLLPLHYLLVARILESSRVESIRWTNGSHACWRRRRYLQVEAAFSGKTVRRYFNLSRTLRHIAPTASCLLYDVLIEPVVPLAIGRAVPSSLHNLLESGFPMPLALVPAAVWHNREPRNIGTEDHHPCSVYF
jgi:hypothetical protein